MQTLQNIDMAYVNTYLYYYAAIIMMIILEGNLPVIKGGITPSPWFRLLDSRYKTI